MAARTDGGKRQAPCDLNEVVGHVAGVHRPAFQRRRSSLRQPEAMLPTNTASRDGPGRERSQGLSPTHTPSRRCRRRRRRRWLRGWCSLRTSEPGRKLTPRRRVPCSRRRPPRRPIQPSRQFLRHRGRPRSPLMGEHVAQPRTAPAKGHGRRASAARNTASSSLLRQEVGWSATWTLTSGYTVITTFPVFCPVSTYR